MSSIVCLKEVLWDWNVAYSCEVVCTQRLLSLFVQEYPRITNFIPCDTFATGSATELQSQPGLLIVNGEISQTLCAKYQNIIWTQTIQFTAATENCCVVLLRPVMWYYWDLSWGTTETCRVVLLRPVVWYYWDLSCGTTETCHVALLRPVVWHYWDLLCGTIMRPVTWHYWDLSCGTTETCRVALLRPVTWHYTETCCVAL